MDKVNAAWLHVVRAEAMNRVASAVGEGSMAISFVHIYLAEVK